MRLVTFKYQEAERLGVQIFRNGEAFIVDLNQANPSIPSDILRFLQGGEALFSVAKKAVERIDESHLIPERDVKLLAPVPRPGKIICLGLNYRDHVAEGNRAIPDYPTIFTKYANAVIGPGEPIVLPKVSSQVDYEVEMAVIIGKRGRHIPEADAFRFVAGYTAFHDVSARDYQFRTTQWTIGKTFDTFAPMGPALVTSDELTDPANVNLSLTLNGKEMQRSNTRHLIFTIPFLLNYLSQVMTLEPGDVIATGTPSGVGVYREPQIFLKDGDVVALHLDKIGDLVNPVMAEK